MGLSNELVSQFAKLTKSEEKPKTETTVYGTIVVNGGTAYVQLDGSEVLTPVSTTAKANNGERVMITIKDHTATIVGNISSPAARTGDVERIEENVDDLVVIKAHKVTADDIEAITGIFNTLIAIVGRFTDLSAITGEFERLKATFIEGGTLKVEDIEAITATLDSIKADIGEFGSISAEELEVVNASIDNLKATTAEFTYISTLKADIKELIAGRADINLANIAEAAIENLKSKFATLDFADIGEAAIRKILADTGLIKDLVVGDQSVTGEFVGVTISGDLIKAETLKAGMIYLRGSDGKYYPLTTDFVAAGVEPVEEDSIHGSVIVANSITANKMNVKDLAAFEATLAGFHINRNYDTGIGTIHSGSKESVDNPLRGIYMDDNGQFALGNDSSFLKFYKVLDENGHEVLNDDGQPIYRLEISADSVLFGSDSKTSVGDLKKLTEHVKIGTIVDDETGNQEPCVELGEGDTDFRQVITNTKTRFMSGADVGTEISKDGIKTTGITVKNELVFGDTPSIENGVWQWSQRPNGNLGLIWKGVTN